MGKRKILSGGLLSLIVISFVWAITMQYLVKSNEDIVGEYEMQNYLLMSDLTDQCKQEMLAGNPANLNAVLEKAIQRADFYYARLQDKQGNVLAQAGDFALGMRMGEISKSIINVPADISNDASNALAIIEDHMPEYEIGKLTIGSTSTGLVELKSRYRKMNMVFYLGAIGLSILIFMTVFAMLAPVEIIKENIQVAYQAEELPAVNAVTAVENAPVQKRKPGRKPGKKADNPSEAKS